MSKLLLLVLLGSGLTQATAQNFTMLQRVLQVQDFASRQATGDFDGDKKPDILLMGNFGVSLLRGNGDGTFQPGITTPIGGIFAFRPPVADFNLDGRTDLLTGAELYLGQVDGAFRALRLTDPIFSANPYLSNFITADFNEDGIPDLAGQDGSTYRVLLGDGAGMFQRSFAISGIIVPSLGGPQPIVSYTTDINHDGHIDLVLRSTGSMDNPTVFRIFNGNGRGSFQETTSIRIPLQGASLAAQGDFNGDQINDWALNTALISSGSFLLFGNPDGTFQDPVTLAGGYVGLSGDFDSNGMLDLLLMTGGQGTIYLSSGGGFSPSVRVVGDSPILLADWNADGRLDLAKPQPGFVSILLNTLLAPGENTSTPVESSATPLAMVAPGSLATLFGSGLSTETEASPVLSGTLAGTQLRVRDAAGHTLPAELLYVSPNQINFRLPPSTAVGDATIDVANGTGAFVRMGVAHVEAAAPTLFGCGYGSNTIIAAAEPGTDTFTVEPPPCPGDQLQLPAIVTFYGTGFAGATVDNTQVWVHGVALKPLYAGPAGTVPGLDKVVVRIDRTNLSEPGDPYWSWTYITMNGRKTNGGYTGIY